MTGWHSEVAHDCPALIATTLPDFSFAAWPSSAKKLVMQMMGHIVYHLDHGFFFFSFLETNLSFLLLFGGVFSLMFLSGTVLLSVSYKKTNIFSGCSQYFDYRILCVLP